MTDQPPDPQLETAAPPRLRLAVHGAAGRMGQRIVALASHDPELAVVAAIESPAHPFLGRDAGEIAGVGPIGVPVVPELGERADVVVDFSMPEAAVRMAQQCSERMIPLVLATTGLNAAQKESVRTAAHQTPILMAPSMSLAVNLMFRLVRDAARALRRVASGVDVEIIERHHRYKEDAPSGTALEFGRIVADEMGQTHHVHGREGRIGRRPRNEIGYHALRTGDNVGEHTIVFGLLGETIDLAVKGHTRDSYAHGALLAARFLVQQGPGLYSMADVLDAGNV